MINERLKRRIISPKFDPDNKIESEPTDSTNRDLNIAAGILFYASSHPTYCAINEKNRYWFTIESLAGLSQSGPSPSLSRLRRRHKNTGYSSVNQNFHQVRIPRLFYPTDITKDHWGS